MLEILNEYNKAKTLAKDDLVRFTLAVKKADFSGQTMMKFSDWCERNFTNLVGHTALYHGSRHSVALTCTKEELVCIIDLWIDHCKSANLKHPDNCYLYAYARHLEEADIICTIQDIIDIDKDK